MGLTLENTQSLEHSSHIIILQHTHTHTHTHTRTQASKQASTHTLCVHPICCKGQKGLGWSFPPWALSSPESPENGAKQEADSDGIEEPHAVVFGHSPVGRPELVEHGAELHHEGFGVLGVELESLGPLFGAAELIQQFVILPGEQQTPWESIVLWKSSSFLPATQVFCLQRKDVFPVNETPEVVQARQISHLWLFLVFLKQPETLQQVVCVADDRQEQMTTVEARGG